MEVLLLQDSPCLCTNNYAHVHKHIHSCNRPTYASIFQEHVFNIFIQCGEDYPPMYTQGQEEKGEFKENRKETTVERKKKWTKKRDLYPCITWHWSDSYYLHYFNLKPGHTIDPNRCLFIGIARTVTEYSLKTGILSKQGIAVIQLYCKISI